MHVPPGACASERQAQEQERKRPENGRPDSAVDKATQESPEQCGNDDHPADGPDQTEPAQKRHVPAGARSPGLAPDLAYERVFVVISWGGHRSSASRSSRNSDVCSSTKPVR